MRKFLLGLMVVILILGIAGCNGTSDDQEVNQNNGSETTSNTNSSDSNSSSNDSWPSDIDSVPEFVYGDITRIQDMSEEYDGIDYISYSIDFEDVDSDAGEKYSRDLLDAGFRESQDSYSYESSLSGATVTEYGFDYYFFEVNDTQYGIQVDFWTDDANSGSVYISVPVEPEGAVEIDQEDSEYYEETDDNESDYNWDTLDEKEVPDDYPYDSVPITEFSSSVVLGADRQEMGGMGVSYVIIFGIDEDINTVSETIRGELEDYVLSHGGTFSALGTQIFMGESGDCEYTIAIGDGTADGYKTTVDYTVIQKTS